MCSCVRLTLNKWIYSQGTQLYCTKFKKRYIEFGWRISRLSLQSISDNIAVIGSTHPLAKAYLKVGKSWGRGIFKTYSVIKHFWILILIKFALFVGGVNTTTLPPTTKPPTTTTPVCPPPKIPVSCKPQCSEQCHFLSPCVAVKPTPPCTPGCVCPNGTVSDGVTCRMPSQCPCVDYKGYIKQAR